MQQPIINDANRVKSRSVAVSLTQNMAGEVDKFRRNQLEMAEVIHNPPAKINPSKTMRRLSITQSNLSSFNTLFKLGNIRKE